VEIAYPIEKNTTKDSWKTEYRQR